MPRACSCCTTTGAPEEKRKCDNCAPHEQVLRLTHGAFAITDTPCLSITVQQHGNTHKHEARACAPCNMRASLRACVLARAPPRACASAHGRVSTDRVKGSCCSSIGAPLAFAANASACLDNVNVTQRGGGSRAGGRRPHASPTTYATTSCQVG